MGFSFGVVNSLIDKDSLLDSCGTLLGITLPQLISHGLFIWCAALDQHHPEVGKDTKPANNMWYIQTWRRKATVTGFFASGDLACKEPTWKLCKDDTDFPAFHWHRKIMCWDLCKDSKEILAIALQKKWFYNVLSMPSYRFRTFLENLVTFTLQACHGHFHELYGLLAKWTV